MIDRCGVYTSSPCDCVSRSKSVPSGKQSPTLAGSTRLPKVPCHCPLRFPRVTNILYCYNVTLWDPSAFSDHRESLAFCFLSSLYQPLVLSLRIQTLSLPRLLFSCFPSVIVSRDAHYVTLDRSSEDAAHMHVSGPDDFVQCWPEHRTSRMLIKASVTGPRPYPLGHAPIP